MENDLLNAFDLLNFLSHHRYRFKQAEVAQLMRTVSGG